MFDPNPQYELIAREIIARCPGDFTRAKLEAELDDGFSRMALTCTLPDGREEGVSLGGAQSVPMDDALLELQESWPSGPWSKCVFELRPGGEFKFDVAYDD